MASKAQHIAQWLHNRAFIGTIDPKYHDWIATVVFYTALQAVDALLAHDSQKVEEHRRRNALLASENRYLHIWRHYFPLYGLGRTVRYVADPATWIPATQIDDRLIRRYLYPIEKSVQGLIDKHLDLSLIQIGSAAGGA